MTGNPRCEKCNGRGGTLRHGRWYRCECVRVTPAKIAANRRLGEVGGAKYVTLSERLEQMDHDRT